MVRIPLRPSTLFPAHITASRKDSIAQLANEICAHGQLVETACFEPFAPSWPEMRAWSTGDVTAKVAGTVPVPSARATLLRHRDDAYYFQDCQAKTPTIMASLLTPYPTTPLSKNARIQAWHSCELPLFRTIIFFTANNRT
jgi:hypothetical protein